MMNDLLSKLASLWSGVGPALLVSGIVLLCMYALEVGLIGWKESSLRKLLQGGGNVYTDCISAVLVLSNASVVIGTVLSFGFFFVLQKVFKEHASFALMAGVSTPWQAYLLFLVALDCSNYWTHRLMHQIGPLWELHKFHHSAQEMTMINVLRSHPLERVFNHAMNAIPAALLGVPAAHYLLLRLALQCIGFLKHSNIHSDWGWIGTWLIQSPSAHRAHHSVKAEHHNINYAVIFQFWDVLFGTDLRTDRRASRDMQIGLVPDYASSHPLHLYVQTVRDFYGALYRSLCRRS